MATSSRTATPGGSESKPNQAKRSSSKLDVLLEKLHNTADVPASSSDTKAGRSGASRRKPKVVLKVMGSADEDDEEDYAELNGDASPGLGNGRVNGEGAGSHDDNDIMDTTVDEHGNHFLADGTMVVQPEAVVERKAQFKGPEFSKSRKVHAGDLDKVTCTGCNKQVNPNIRNAARRHPVLKVLICKKCYDWYTSDEIDQDSDGMDEQCRWCGEGGNLLCCDFCHNAFCRGCIKRNLGRAEVSSAEDDEKWHCYVCNPRPLKKLMAHCTEVLDMSDELRRQSHEKEAKGKQPVSGPGKGKGKTSQGKSTSGKGKGSTGSRPMGHFIPRSPHFKTLAADFDITPNNTKPVLDRLLAATTSFQMFLASLDSDYKNHTKKNEVQGEVARKLKRAMLAYKKLFCDIESFACGSHQVKEVPQGKKLTFPSPVKSVKPQPQSSAAGSSSSQSASKSGRLSLPKDTEIIELSDSSEEESPLSKSSQIKVNANKEKIVKTETQITKNDTTEMTYKEESIQSKENDKSSPANINEQPSIVKDNEKTSSTKGKEKTSSTKENEKSIPRKDSEKLSSGKDERKVKESFQEKGNDEEPMDIEASPTEQKTTSQPNPEESSELEDGLEASQDLFDDCISQLKGLDDSGTSAAPQTENGEDTGNMKVSDEKTRKPKETDNKKIRENKDKKQENDIVDKENTLPSEEVSTSENKHKNQTSSTQKTESGIPEESETSVENSIDKESVVDDLPSADKDVEDYNQGDFLSVYRAALDAEVNKDSQDEDEAIEDMDGDGDGESEDDVSVTDKAEKPKRGKGKSKKEANEGSDDDVPLAQRKDKIAKRGRAKPTKERRDESDDSESEDERLKKASKAQRREKKESAESSSEEKERSKVSKGKGKSRNKDSDSDDAKQVKSRPQRRGKAIRADTDSDSEGDEPAKKTTKGKDQQKSSKQKVKKDESDSEEDEKPKRRLSKSKTKVEKEDSDDDSETPRTPKGKGKGKGKSSSPVKKKSEGESPKKKMRSREDIEAQRLMHQEMLEGDSSDSDNDKDKGDDSDSVDSLQESSSSNNSDEAQVSDYDPKADIKQARADKKLSRTESAKRKTQSKFSELRRKREQQKQKEKQKEKEKKRQREKERRRKKRKGKEDSSSESSSDSEDEKPAKKKPKAKTFFDELSDTDRKEVKKGKKSKGSDSEEEEKEKKPKTKKSRKAQSEDESDIDSAKSKKTKTEKAEKKAPKKEEESDSEGSKSSKKKDKAKKKEKVDDSEGESETEKTKTKKEKSDKKDAEEKLKSEKEKVKKEKPEKKDNADSSDSSDSDLDKEIEKLASLPARNPVKKKEAEDSTKEDKRKIKKSQDKTPDKSVHLSRKERAARKGVDIDELGSESDGKEEPADEDMEVDEANGSDSSEDPETLRKLREMAEEQAADAKARSALLADDSDSALSSGSSDAEDDDSEKKKQKKEKKEVVAAGASSDSSAVHGKPKKKVRSTALLNAKISDSDDSEIEEIEKKTKKKKKKDSDDEEFEVVDEEDEEDDEAMAELLEEEDENGIVSIASDSDTSVGKGKKKKKKKKKKDESEEEEEEEEEGGKKGKKGKGKRKRKRIKAMSDSSEPETEDSDAPKPKKKKRKKKKGSGDEEEAEEAGSGEGSDENTPGKKRKNIKKIIKDKKLSQDTKTAAKAEEERRKRVQERQKLYNLVQEEKEEEAGNKVVMTTKLVLETDKREGKEGKVLIEVHKDIINKLKPHQVEAVKFLWDCLVESLEMLKTDPGAGCILAHCMGLGKTLSMISFIHTLLINEKKTKQRTCIVVCPLNTVLNWENEFSKWQPDDPDKQLDIYELTTVKDNWGRADRLKDWHEGGGVLIMGYEMYRNLSQCKRVRNKKQKKVFAETLVDPGPDLVVCDEGHILKNDKSSTSIAMNAVRTRRRVVLTGTPLQNNLGEYHCMVDFVKPSLLGTRKEFSNRFVNPITNGQCANASKWDVKLMKKRAHILHETLAGCVQRRDYAALTKFLPPKHEYILSIRLSKVQCELYAKYLDLVGRSGTIEKGDVRGASLFSDYQNLSRIWTHPWILRLHEVREQNKKMFDDEDSFLDDESDLDDSFIDDSDSDDSDPKWGKKKKNRGNGETEEAKEDQPKAGTSSGKRGSDRDSDVEVVKKWNTRSRGRDGSDRSEPEEEVKEERLSKEWWADYVTEDDQYKLELSGKLFILAEILKMSEAIGDKVLVFSQSLLSLDLIEDFLEHWDKAVTPENPEEQVAGAQSWTHGIDYFRMDGSTNSALRKKWSEIFNDRENPRARLFLISTKAGSLGTNMVGANRCIIFDASWNPTHDVQSIFRVYRFGQTKPVYIYRFLAQGTMEEKIYERQVTKQSLSSRVVDEHQIERHFTSESLQELYNFTPDRLDDPNRTEKPTPVLPKDRMLAEMIVSQKDHIVGYHEHDSLLENQIDEELSEEDRKAAWEEYEAEKKGLIQRVAMPNYQQPRFAQPNPYGQMMGPPPSMNVFPHLTEVARAIRSANPNVSMAELQQRLEHYMRLQMVSGPYQQQMYQQQQQMQQYAGMQQQQQQMMSSGPEPGEVTFMGYGQGGGAAAQGQPYAAPRPQQQAVSNQGSAALYSMLNGSKKE